MRGQRFLQVSAAMPGKDGVYRLAPLAFLPTPTPQKPTRNAATEQRTPYRLAARDSRLRLRAAQQMIQLRQSLDQDAGGKQRTWLLAFDGGYTNATVLKQIPPHTTCLGRIRKAARLCFPPDPALRKTRGRRLRYGADAPTPISSAPTSRSKPWHSRIPVSLINW